MGLIDIHLHDSTLEFNPSLQLGPTTEVTDEEAHTTEDDAPATDGDHVDEAEQGSGKRKLQLLVAMVILAGVAIAIRRVRS